MTDEEKLSVAEKVWAELKGLDLDCEAVYWLASNLSDETLANLKQEYDAAS